MNKGRLRGKGQPDSVWTQLVQVPGKPETRAMYRDQYGTVVNLLEMTW